MASSSYRGATVEEYDEPSDNDARGGAAPYAEASVDSVVPLLTPTHEPHVGESHSISHELPSQSRQSTQYAAEAHHSPCPRPHREVEPQPPQLPAAPTPPPNPAPRKSKRKPGTSSRRRTRDRPEYYGVRGASTSVVPADPPPPRSSNIRMARRPTTGWYVSGSPPGGPADPMPEKAPNSHPRIEGPPGGVTRPPQDVQPVNTFRSPSAIQIRGQQSLPRSHNADRNDWETAESPRRGPEPPYPSSGAPNYPPAQPNHSGFVVLSQAQHDPTNNPNKPVNEMNQGYARAPPPPVPQPPQQAPGHNPHGVIVLSSNNSRTDDAANGPSPQREFYSIPPGADQHPSQSPYDHPSPMTQHDGRATAHQVAGRRSVHPVHMPPAQPRNEYRENQDYSPQDARSPMTTTSYPEIQRLTLEDVPASERKPRQLPPPADAGYFRSQDSASPPSRFGGVSNALEPSANTAHQTTRGWQRERYPDANEPRHYTPHSQPQRRNSHDQQPAPNYPPRMKASAPQGSEHLPESPKQWAPKTAHPQHPQSRFHPIPEENNLLPSSGDQMGYPSKPLRIGPPPSHSYPRESYHGPEEGFEPELHEPNTSWSHKHPEDRPTLPDGHPFLRMKDMALATILKDFRAWQTGGMPGRRGPHGRRPPFSCPFAKKDPLHYKDCFSDALPSIRDVKEHISRCHAIPIYCPRCMDLFDDETARDSHIRGAACRPQQWSCPEGVTEAQKRQLRTAVPTYLPPQDQWSQIFFIVFPRLAPPPESPYVEETLHEDVSTYREFLETRGPKALSDILTFRGAATWNLPNEERDLAAFRCVMLDEGIRDLVDQWARRHGGDSLRSPSSLTSSSSADPQRTPSMGSFASSDGQGRAYLPSSPVEVHQWELRPRIHEEGWDDYDGHPSEHMDSADPRRQKLSQYAAPRREADFY